MASEHYWSVDFPGLNGADAQRICDLVRESGMPYEGIPADPNVFPTLHMDRPTVEFLTNAVARMPSDSGAQAMREILDAWLAEQTL